MGTGQDTRQCGQMRLTRTEILWSSERRGVGHVDSSRGDVCWVRKVWSSMGSGCLASLLGDDDKRDDKGHGETFFRWSEQADQASPMRKAELR